MQLRKICRWIELGMAVAVLAAMIFLFVAPIVFFASIQLLPPNLRLGPNWYILLYVVLFVISVPLTLRHLESEFEEKCNLTSHSNS